MANRAIDLLITYRVIKLLVTPFNKQEAFKTGIIDKNGKVLKKYRTLKTAKEKKSYTMLHRFIFNLKRILAKVGIRGALGSFAVSLALLIKEDKELSDKPINTCFGIDVYEVDGELLSEQEYAKTL